ncbi:tRNA-specific 2-thiouridylase MnmA [termite gut metagenome]|uniref:tRNA-specific 2-thiouridylase MnmA n=1 Tax=termite gut metagenome TaxID=433724 RepID=A0A5J4SR70_9ZZZZ
MQIATLLSGGVDSSTALHLLCERGYKPDLFYIKIGMEEDPSFSCNAEEDMELVSFIACKYGLKMEIIDLHKQYWENVVAYTIDKVKNGLTPNPDVMCNKLIKFGCFEEQVGRYYDKTATGHYATIQEKGGKIWLGTAKDLVKDQTDFLAQIDYLQVSKLMFPIGDLSKQEVRRMATEVKLPSAYRKDSQGICFLGRINYNDFLRRFLGEKKGSIIELETGKCVGTHSGYWFHTVGQRKGLKLGGGPWFVIRKNVEENIIYVSHGYDTEKQYGNTFILRDFHFITDNPWGNKKQVNITFKIRHTPAFTKGTLQCEGDSYLVYSEEKLQGIAPGQFGVVYDEKAEICVGSGEIG